MTPFASSATKMLPCDPTAIPVGRPMYPVPELEPNPDMNAFHCLVGSDQFTGVNGASPFIGTYATSGGVDGQQCHEPCDVTKSAPANDDGKRYAPLPPEG